MAVEISYYNVRLVSLQGVGMVQVVVYTWSVQQHQVLDLINSTFSSSQTEMLFTIRPSLIKTELPCLLCGCSAASAIPGILGLAWSLNMCVSWRQRQCCSLHISDSMDALLAVRPSTFADITVNDTDMVCSLMLRKN